MGWLETFLLLFNIAGGIESQSAAQKEASAMRDEAEIQKQERLDEAADVRKEGRKIKAKQSLAFLASGVELGGSPLGVLEETQRGAETTAEDLVTLAQKEFQVSKAKASAVENKGVAALFGGVAKGLQLGF